MLLVKGNTVFFRAQPTLFAAVPSAHGSLRKSI